jgi:hypothetical protein
VSRALQRTRPSFTKQIRRGALAASQFPEKLSDAHGAITFKWGVDRPSATRSGRWRA